MKDEKIIEKVTSVLKDIKKLEQQIKDLKDLNREDRQGIIDYMLTNKKKFLGELELKFYKGNYYLSISENIF